MHTWEDPEINQTADSEPGRARLWGKGNPEEIPHVSDSNYHQGTTLFLSPPMYVYPHVHFFLLINTLLISLLSISLWQFISTKPKGQGLVTGHWPWRSSGQDCCYLPSISGPKRKSCFKPLQVKATRDQTQRNTLSTYFIILNIFFILVWIFLKIPYAVNFFPVLGVFDRYNIFYVMILLYAACFMETKQFES